MVRTGPEGTPAWWHEFAEFVRRALHTAVDQVEPRADGLESIQARIPAGSARGDREVTRLRRPRRRGRRGAHRRGPAAGGQRP